MNIIQRSLTRGFKFSLAQSLKLRQKINPICFYFSTSSSSPNPQSKNFVMKKSELSNELLISLSMGFEHKEATNQKELTENLIQNNVLKSKVVQESFNDLDRDLFAMNKKQKIYANNPLSIGQGQNMTSPLMHAIALEEIHQQLLMLIKQKKGKEIKILDIGCGRGYVAFAIAKIIEKSHNDDLDLQNINVFIKGIDIYDDLTQGAQDVLQKLSMKNNIKFEFSTINIENEIEQKQHIYDIIHTGVALEKEVYDNMVNSIYDDKQDGSCIICPVIQQDLEQNLLIRTNGQEHTIMKCVYSQMISLKQQEVSKYFLQDGDIAEEEEEGESPSQKNKEESEEEAALLQNTKMQRDIYKFEQQLKFYEATLKEFHDSFKKNNNGQSPTLKDFNSNIAIKKLLSEIQQTKKNIKFTKAKLQLAQS